MSVTEILQLADRLILKQEGRHLDEIEELIIKGTWENKTYQEISKECNLGESRVRNIGSKLWNILSESLATSINKDNFRSIFKRLKNIESYQNICNLVSFRFSSFDFVHLTQNLALIGELLKDLLPTSGRITVTFGTDFVNFD